MNVIGIVCEYNPFHNGHLYHIEQSKRELGKNALIICIMSGDFVQRGEAAMFSKYARAEAACRCGADIVVELPLPWCISSAEKYASGAVDILAACGCTHISFGSECGDIDALKNVAELLLDAETRENIISIMNNDKTLSYARARQIVISKKAIADTNILNHANNILGTEYLKSVMSSHPEIIPFTVKRIGNGHNSYGSTGQKSASELREMLLRGENAGDYIPKEALKIFETEINAGRVSNRKVMDNMLLSRLRMFDAEYFDVLPDAGNGTGRKLYKAIRENAGLDSVVEAATDKKITSSRIRRIILCASLGVSADYTNGSPSYIRLLATTNRGRDYLKLAGKSSTIPIITKPAAVRKHQGRQVQLFELSANAHDLYTMQFVTNSDKLPGEDWRRGPVIV